MKFLYTILLVSALTSGQVYDDSQRGDICDRNFSTCTVICYNKDKGTPIINICDPATLNYDCLCSSNYRPTLNNNTMPAATAKCQMEGFACSQACKGSPECAQACEISHICIGTEEKAFNKTESANSTSQNITITAAKPSSTMPSIFESESASSDSLITKVSLFYVLFTGSLIFYQL